MRVCVCMRVGGFIPRKTLFQLFGGRNLTSNATNQDELSNTIMICATLRRRRFVDVCVCVCKSSCVCTEMIRFSCFVQGKAGRGSPAEGSGTEQEWRNNGKVLPPHSHWHEGFGDLNHRVIVNIYCGSFLKHTMLNICICSNIYEFDNKFHLSDTSETTDWTCDQSLCFIETAWFYGNNLSLIVFITFPIKLMFRLHVDQSQPAVIIPPVLGNGPVPNLSGLATTTTFLWGVCADKLGGGSIMLWDCLPTRMTILTIDEKKTAEKIRLTLE